MSTKWSSLPWKENVNITTWQLLQTLTHCAVVYWTSWADLVLRASNSRCRDDPGIFKRLTRVLRWSCYKEEVIEKWLSYRWTQFTPIHLNFQMHGVVRYLVSPASPLALKPFSFPITTFSVPVFICIIFPPGTSPEQNWSN